MPRSGSASALTVVDVVIVVGLGEIAVGRSSTFVILALETARRLRVHRVFSTAMTAILRTQEGVGCNGMELLGIRIKRTQIIASGEITPNLPRNESNLFLLSRQFNLSSDPRHSGLRWVSTSLLLHLPGTGDQRKRHSKTGTSG